MLEPVDSPGGPVPVRRVRKAYEQVADQLRELILSGELARGDRLPNENALARDFGVSRATIREALRVLAAQSLVRTAKGAGGGSYVTSPSLDHISAFLHAGINLMTESSGVTLDELLEARALLEVPAARLAAARRSEQDVEAIRASIPGHPLRLPVQDEFAANTDFHSSVLGACGNTLLVIACQPIFTVLATNLVRGSLPRTFRLAINEQHREIAALVESGDGDGSGEAMQAHLGFLRPYYEKVWKHAVKAKPEA